MKCGISDENSTNFALFANSTRKTLQANHMKYILGDQFTREYDACHYVLSSDMDY